MSTHQHVNMKGKATMGRKLHRATARAVQSLAWILVLASLAIAAWIASVVHA